MTAIIKNKRTKSKVSSLYEEITAKIVNLLERGVKPWEIPWKSSDIHLSLPYNLATGNKYTGSNILRLWLNSNNKKYCSNAWLTFRQAQKLGGKVKKGEKGVHCLRYALIDVEDSETKEIGKQPMLNTFVLFNKAQVDGLDIKEEPIDECFDFRAMTQVDSLIQDTNAEVRFGFDQAFYHSREDYIGLPDPQSFKTTHSYYVTALHELIHWTGHKTRLNRLEKARKFGDQKYAFEELVAELGSAFLCAELKLQGQLEDHASYIDSWIKVLKQDERALFKAATLASQAHQHIMSQAKLSR